MKTILKLLDKVVIDLPLFFFYIDSNPEYWEMKSKLPWKPQFRFDPWLSNSITSGKNIFISLIILPWRIGLNITFFRPYLSFGLNRSM